MLIVDDEESVRRLLGLAFDAAGYEVFCAESPVEAIRLCEQHEFEIILSDVRMPDMDGHQLIRTIAGTCPRTRVVLMTGYDSDCNICPYVDRCRLIQKPFRAEHVLKAVSDALSGPPPSLVTKDPRRP